MFSVYDTLSRLARKTSTAFGELRYTASQCDEPAPAGPGLIYRLKHWPHLPASSRTADVFRALSVMSQRPVNRHWILTNSKLRPGQVDKLLQRLVEEDAVEVVDGSKYLREGQAAAARAA
jgi:hypothetical protein